MPPRLPSNLLDRSAQEASRLLSLSYLDQIDMTHARLGDQLDQEALHDFRVGIRRLRSAFGPIGRSWRVASAARCAGGCTNLARATNDGRDVEVQLDWLGKQSALLGTGRHSRLLLAGGPAGRPEAEDARPRGSRCGAPV